MEKKFTYKRSITIDKMKDEYQSLEKSHPNVYCAYMMGFFIVILYISFMVWAPMLCIFASNMGDPYCIIWFIIGIVAPFVIYGIIYCYKKRNIGLQSNESFQLNIIVKFSKELNFYLLII